MRRTLTLELLKQQCVVDAATGCWLWQGTITTPGYAEIFWGGRRKRVHRLSYEMAKGPIPEGLVPDHLCRVRHCINPAHLEAVTQRENLLRSPDTVAGKHARQTECKNGHPYTEENTIIINVERGWRDCRACRRAKRERARAKRRGA